jgi:hypothetical protein
MIQVEQIHDSTLSVACRCIGAAASSRLEREERGDPMPKKTYPRLPLRIEHAVSLQQRVATGVATPAEAREYRRILNVYRGKFRNGGLSPENARRFGIES